MTRFFFWLATIITVTFFIFAVVLFIAQWVIYYRVEKTKLKNRHERHLSEEKR